MIYELFAFVVFSLLVFNVKYPRSPQLRFQKIVIDSYHVTHRELHPAVSRCRIGYFRPYIRHAGSCLHLVREVGIHTWLRI